MSASGHPFVKKMSGKQTNYYSVIQELDRKEGVASSHPVRQILPRSTSKRQPLGSIVLRLTVQPWFSQIR